MPFIRRQPTKSDEMEEQTQPEQRLTLSAPAGAAPASAPTGGAAPQAKPQPGGTVGGGAFVNLLDYTRANQGAGQAMADKALGGAEKQGAALKAGPNKGPQVMAGSPVMQAAQAQKEAITGLRQMQLGGTSAIDAAKQVEQAANLAGTWGGRQELLAKQSPGATQGERNIDNFLMGQAAGSRLDSLRQQYGGLADYVKTTQDAKRDAMDKAAGARLQAQQAAQQRPVDPSDPTRVVYADGDLSETRTTATHAGKADDELAAKHPKAAERFDKLMAKNPLEDEIALTAENIDAEYGPGTFAALLRRYTRTHGGVKPDAIAKAEHAFNVWGGGYSTGEEK